MIRTFLGGLLVLGLLALAQQGEDLAKRLWQLLAGFSGQDYRLTWHYIPGKPMGFYKGSEPHGAILRTFVNDIAYDAIRAKVGRYPVGAVLVKDNHMPDGTLAAVTVMLKMSEGYYPEGGDWFWAKYLPNGTAEAAGKVAACAACHAQVRNQDYVFSTAVR
ncbi:hypothetical protein FJNA_02280 [Thermus sp. FJN-A]